MIRIPVKQLHVSALVALAIVLMNADPEMAVASSFSDAATVTVTVETAPVDGGEEGGEDSGGDGGSEEDEESSAGLREISIQRKIDEWSSGTTTPDTTSDDTEDDVTPPRRERSPRSTGVIPTPDLHPAAGTGPAVSSSSSLPSSVVSTTERPSLLYCPASFLCIDRLWEGMIARFDVFPIGEVLLWIIGLLIIVAILLFLWILLLLIAKLWKRLRRWIRGRSGWYFFNVIILVVLSYFAVIVYEYSRASNTGVQFIVTSGDITLGCGASVSLGTIQETGDTGPYASERAIECSVATSVSAGYSLSWMVQTGSGGTATGYLINADEDTIAPYAPVIANTPETWSVDSASDAWGARLSSTSDTVSTAVWGTDGIDERWLNVGTGALVIAVRTSSNEFDPDIERIGFRVEIGANASMPAGSYSAEVLFTATTN